MIDGYTTQSIVGIKHLYRGWITKNWININEPPPMKMHTINKVIIKQSVIFYAKAWRHRNEILHDPNFNKEYTIKWYNEEFKRVVEIVVEGNKPEMVKYAKANELNIEQCSTSYIRHWILSLRDMWKKAKSERINDIRLYFTCRRE